MENNENKDVFEEVFGDDEEALLRNELMKVADRAVDEAVDLLEKIRDLTEQSTEMAAKMEESGLLKELGEYIEKYATD